MHVQDSVEMSGSLDSVSASALVCKLVSLLQPSSATADRVFSLLENSFCKRQERSMQDYVCLCYVAIQQALILVIFSTLLKMLAHCRIMENSR